MNVKIYTRRNLIRLYKINKQIEIILISGHFSVFANHLTDGMLIDPHAYRTHSVCINKQYPNQMLYGYDGWDFNLLFIHIWWTIFFIEETAAHSKSFITHVFPLEISHWTRSVADAKHHIFNIWQRIAWIVSIQNSVLSKHLIGNHESNGKPSNRAELRYVLRIHFQEVTVCVTYE